MTTFMESERLWYRSPELEDLPSFARWFNDARVRKHLDHRVFPVSKAAEEEWLKNAMKPVLGTPQVVHFAFGLKTQDALLGCVSLMGIHWISREAELGILIGEPSYWNQGYGREASKRIVDYAFDDLNLNRVKLRVADANQGGRRAYEAVGFVHEGTLREATYSDGAYQDTHVMGVLRREWKR